MQSHAKLKCQQEEKSKGVETVMYRNIADTVYFIVDKFHVYFKCILVLSYHLFAILWVFLVHLVN